MLIHCLASLRSLARRVLLLQPRPVAVQSQQRRAFAASRRAHGRGRAHRPRVRVAPEPVSDSSSGVFLLWYPMVAMTGSLVLCAAVFGGPQTRMIPRGLVRETIAVVSENSVVSERLGTPIRSVDVDDHEEIQFVELADDEGNPVLRVKFNIQGPEGDAYVYAQVGNAMRKGEYTYLVVEFSNSDYVLEIIADEPQWTPSKTVFQRLGIESAEADDYSDF